MPHIIETALKPDVADPGGAKLKARILSDLGVVLEDVRVGDGYLIDREFTPSELESIVREVFFDPVIHLTAIDEPLQIPCNFIIEVGFRPGVTDNVARTAGECIERTLGVRFSPEEGVYSRKLYFITGAIAKSDAEFIAESLLANDLIQTHAVYGPDDDRRALRVPRVTSTAAVSISTVNLEVADEELMRISREGVLALSLDEMKGIRDFFRKPDFIEARRQAGLDAHITDCELEALAQTWSEHCKHKIFNAEIEYVDETGASRVIQSLFKTYIQGSTERIRKEKGAHDYCLSVFKDNAGVIRFDDDWSIAVKVETHNSPSALDPYGGALTGIVGVNRDPFGTGMGASLFFNTDVFCFAPPDYAGRIPKRLLHPRRVFEGVREGVEHGGNKSGIPTVNGAVVFDTRYLGKPLVYCGTGGIMPARINGKPSHEKQALPGDRIVMTGGRIGKDGIHGATFSSEELHEGSPVSAVQIGDPITQRRMTDFLLVARDRGLYTSITDNGAGGLSSSVGEMAQQSGGACLYPDKAPLKYAGLQPWEILLSEAQERMTVAVPPDKIDEFMRLAAELEVEATDLGEFTSDGWFTVRWQDRVAAMLPLVFLHEGAPDMKLKACWAPPAHVEPDFPPPEDLAPMLMKVLGRFNVCSKERLIRQYDHEVQAQTVIKPLVGVLNDGPADAAVLRPLPDSFRGVAIGCGIAPKYSDIDTYWMTACVIDEAVRNIVAVGADPDYAAGLDNFCWCDPVQSEKTPDGEYKLAQLVRANQALYDVTVPYGIPCISGKDSMKNDYHIGDTKISIPPTILFTAVGIVPDVRKAVSSDVKRAGDLVYVLGLTRDETGGSEYFAELGFIGRKVPTLPNPPAAMDIYRTVHKVMQAGLIASCHDVSDGGLGVCLAETAFGGGFGVRAALRDVPGEGLVRDDDALFSESPGRFVVTVRPAHQAPFEEAFSGMPVARIGEVTDAPRLVITGLTGAVIVDADILDLKHAWQKPLGV